MEINKRIKSILNSFNRKKKKPANGRYFLHREIFALSNTIGVSRPFYVPKGNIQSTIQIFLRYLARIIRKMDADLSG